MPFGLWIRRDPRTRVLDVNPHWRQLANTMDQSTRRVATSSAEVSGCIKAIWNTSDHRISLREGRRCLHWPTSCDFLLVFYSDRRSGWNRLRIVIPSNNNKKNKSMIAGVFICRAARAAFATRVAWWCNDYGVGIVGKLFTPMCPQAVQFGAGQRAAMPCGWEGNRRSSVTLAKRHRLTADRKS